MTLILILKKNKIKTTKNKPTTTTTKIIHWNSLNHPKIYNYFVDYWLHGLNSAPIYLDFRKRSPVNIGQFNAFTTLFVREKFQSIRKTKKALN